MCYVLKNKFLLLLMMRQYVVPFQGMEFLHQLNNER